MVKRMSKVIFGFLALLMIHAPVHAKLKHTLPPLRIAVAQFIPPFVMQGPKNTWDGFDIFIINHLCKRLERTCQYLPTPLDELLTAVENNLADMSIGAITITPRRTHRVSFSLPYMISYGRFLGRVRPNPESFTHHQLTNKKIGVLKGSVFVDTLHKMGVKNSQIIPFSDSISLIDALNLDNIVVALVDDPTATYWQVHSSGHLQALGELVTPTLGFGLGIATRRDDPLLTSINVALLDFEDTDEFKQVFTMYFGGLQ